jgi:phosphopantothenoylcysteine decarboxylase/phosphopantothenate--cysteine ligase
MWAHPVAMENVAKLMKLGYRFIGPEDGWLACRNTGPGRLSEPGRIVEEIVAFLQKGQTTSDGI